MTFETVMLTDLIGTEIRSNVDTLYDRTSQGKFAASFSIAV